MCGCRKATKYQPTTGSRIRGEARGDLSKGYRSFAKPRTRIAMEANPHVPEKG